MESDKSDKSSPKSIKFDETDASNLNGARKSQSNSRKGASPVNSSSATTSSSKKSSRSPSSGSSTDWRLNLQGVVPKWEYLLENQLYTDITFLVGPSRKSIKCHSLVLKMQSKHFETMLTPDKNEYEVPNCCPAVFQKMLKYLYTDKLELAADDAMDALILARQFHLTPLQVRCGRIVLEQINVSNAAIFLKKAEDIGDKQLSLKVQEYILQHAAQVVFTPAFKEISLVSLQKLLQTNRALWKLAEVKILEAVKTWASAECSRQGLPNTGPNQYQVAKGALDLINYTQFSPMQFTLHVVKPKLLPADKMLDIQSELIEKEESTKSEYSGSISQEQNGEDVDPDLRTEEEDGRSLNQNSIAKSNSQETIVVTEDIDQVKYDQIYTLSRYSTLTNKDWAADSGSNDGNYKISFNATKSINIVALVLYGHANGANTLTDVYIQFMNYDEEKTLLEFETKSELPEIGGEFEVKLPHPLTIKRMEWCTILVNVNGRVYPTGIGGKRAYNIDTSSGEMVSFYFKNSKDVSGATHVRGQLPKILFSVPPVLT